MLTNHPNRQTRKCIKENEHNLQDVIFNPFFFANKTNSL